MLTKLFSEEDKKRFLLFAELLSIADKPLLWDGKKKEEVTARTDMAKLSIQKGEVESKLLSEWGWKESLSLPFFGGLAASKSPITQSGMDKGLIELLKNLPLQQDTEKPDVRWNAAVSPALRELLTATPFTNTYATRIALYELMLLALADGMISPVEYRFLEEFQHHHSVEDFAFKEILERAESMYRETQKTIALVLE